MKHVKQVFFKALASAKLAAFLLAAAIAGAILSSLMPPLVLERIVNMLAQKHAVPLILALIYYAAILFSGLFQSARDSLLIVFGQKITFQVRKEMCRKLDRLPAEYYVSTMPGQAASRFIGDADTLESLFTDGIISMVSDLVRIISIFAIIFVKSQGLGIILLLMVPPVFLLTRYVQKQMLKAQLMNRSAAAKASGKVPEAIHNIRTIHNLGKEEYICSQFEANIEEGFRASEKNNFYDSCYSPIILVLNALTVAGVMILAALPNPRLKAFFAVTPGTAAALITYIAQVFGPLESIGMEIQTIQSAAAGIKRIEEFLSLPERRIPTEKLAPTPEVPCIQVQNLSFSYEDQVPVLQDLNFSINKGEPATLSGRTGSGKTTIFKLLLGLYEPKTGQVLIEGVPAGSIADSEKRRIFGWVEQSFKSVPGSILDQITLLDPSVTLQQARKAAETAGILQVIEALPEGFDTPFENTAFSQGQLQLLSIARAIAADPKILLLDEITANLDAQTEQTLLESLIRASENRTVISISHRLYASLGGKEICITDH